MSSPSKAKGEVYENQKRVRSNEQKVIKVEKQISRREKEIKAIDIELEINYEQTIAQPNFFNSYQQKKNEQARKEKEEHRAPTTGCYLAGTAG